MVIKHDELISVYKEMLNEKNKKSVLNISTNTGDVLSKSHPKSKIVTRYEEELFGLDPEEIRKLPIKSVEMIQQALQFLIQKAKEDPIVFQALRKLIHNASVEVEEANPIDDEPSMYDESIISNYKNFLSGLSTGSPMLTEATINYKALSAMKPVMAKKSASFKMFLDAFNLSIEGMTTQQLQGAVMFANQIGQQVVDNPELKSKFATLFAAEQKTAKKETPKVKETSTDFDSTFKEAISRTTLNMLKEDTGIAINPNEGKNFRTWFQTELTSAISEQDFKKIYPLGAVLLNTGAQVGADQIKKIVDAIKLIKDASKRNEIFNKIKTDYKTIFDNMIKLGKPLSA